MSDRAGAIARVTARVWIWPCAADENVTRRTLLALAEELEQSGVELLPDEHLAGYLRRMAAQ